MKKGKNNKNQGGALILVSLSMVAAGLLGAAMLAGLASSRSQRVHFDSGNRAMYAVESGRAYVLARLAEDPDYIPDGTYTFASGDQFIASGQVVSNILEVTLEGIAHPGTHRERVHGMTMQFALASDDEEDPGGQGLDLDTVFVSASELIFRGNTLSGAGGTVVLRGGLSSASINQGSALAISTMYIDGDVNFTTGNASLGSPTEPGAIYINGDLTLRAGPRHIYGDVFVNGDLIIANATIHGNLYVAGNVTFEWGSPTLMPGSTIYHTGTVSSPGWYPQSVIDRAVQVESVPSFEIPSDFTPQLHPDAWYADRGYQSGGQLVSDMRVFADNYSSTSWRPPAQNVVIVSKGDIRITGLGGSGVTGVLIAPFGEVVFHGAYFTGMVLAGNGFHVTSGGTTVTFENISSFFSSVDDIPIVTEN